MQIAHKQPLPYACHLQSYVAICIQHYTTLLYTATLNSNMRSPGCSVISVKDGFIRYVHYLMAGGMLMIIYTSALHACWRVAALHKVSSDFIV
jgi:hypothetical protein